MAKFKVHKTDDAIVGDLESGAVCKTKRRTLLPLHVTHEWSAVTCERCLRHRPRELSLWDRFLASPSGVARGWFYRITGRKQR